MRLIRVGGGAVITLGCAAAFVTPAAAEPQLSPREAEFVSSVSWLYSGGRNLLSTGYEVCTMLDRGMRHEGIERFLAGTFNDQRANSGYYATLFAQYATYNLCPRNMDEYGGPV